MAGVNVGLVLLVKDKKILVVSRKDNHNSFGLIGGKMDPEDEGCFKTTAIRETLEETGINISNKDLIEITNLHYRGNHCVTFLVEGCDEEANSTEEGVVKWGSPQDLLDGSFGDYNKIVLENYMDLMERRNQKLLN